MVVLCGNSNEKKTTTTTNKETKQKKTKQKKNKFLSRNVGLDVFLAAVVQNLERYPLNKSISNG